MLKGNDYRDIWLKVIGVIRMRGYMVIVIGSRMSRVIIIKRVRGYMG
jgi:hypothetical protein